MFTTFESAEVPIPPIFEFPDQRWWGYVGLYRWSAYFHTVIEYDDERGERATRVIIYAGVDQVIGTAESSEVNLVELQMILTPGLTGKNFWSMEPLSEVYMGFEPDTEVRQHAVVYVLANGARLVDSARGTPEKELVDLTLKVYIANKTDKDDPDN